jgi:ABC-type multidrug transport system fused ATPase/permease subunit
MASPWLLKLAVDDLTSGVDSTKVRFYAVSIFGLAAVAGVFRFFMRRVIVGASRSVEYDLRNEFFAHLQRLDLAYFQHHRTGDLMSRATNDLSAVRMMIGPAIMYTATTALTCIVAVVMMLSLNARLTLIALLPLPLISISVKYFGAIIHSRSERIQAQLSEISAIAAPSRRKRSPAYESFARTGRNRLKWRGSGKRTTNFCAGMPGLFTCNRYSIRWSGCSWALAHWWCCGWAAATSSAAG